MGSRGTRRIDGYGIEHTEWCMKCEVEFTWVDSSGDGDPASHPHDCIKSLAKRIAALESARLSDASKERA